MSNKFSYYYFSFIVDIGAIISGSIAALRAAIYHHNGLAFVFSVLTILAINSFRKDLNGYLMRIGMHPKYLYCTTYEPMNPTDMPIVPYSLYYCETEDSDFYYYDYWNFKGQLVRKHIPTDEMKKYKKVYGLLIE